jgi:inner membrane protein
MAAARIARDRRQASESTDRTLNARPLWPSMAAWSALSLLPDADVIGFPMGVRYGDPWGHRGATHSLTFAVALAAALTLLAARHHRSRLSLWLMATVVLVSHGLLDTMTDGGLGAALLWPFDLTRYFAPWRPIPVAPIGLDFFSPYGLFVSSIEVVLFAPLFVYALRPKHLSRFLIPIWCVLVWLTVSTDPARETVLSVVLREKTEYAPAFSERSFRTIDVGLSEARVRTLIGTPLGEWWDYRPPRTETCPFVYIESDVVAVEDRAERAAAMCAQHGIHAGMSRTDVDRALGPPDSVCWRYSRSSDALYFRARVVCFAEGKVEMTISRWARR